MPARPLARTLSRRTGPVAWLLLGAWLLGALALAVVQFRAEPMPAAVARVVATIPLPSAPSAGLAADDASVWVPSDLDGSIMRIDPSTNQVAATIQLGAGPSCSLCWGAVTVHGTSVWATSRSARLSLVGIDTVANRASANVLLPIFPSAVVGDSDGSVWLASVLDNAVVRIDPLQHVTRARISLPRPSRLAAGDGAIWVIAHQDDRANAEVARIDPGTSRVVSSLEVGMQPAAIAFGQGSVWVIDQSSQVLQRIDPSANAIVASVPVGSLPAGLAVDDHSIWVASQTAPGTDGPALSRVSTTAGSGAESLFIGPGAPVGLAVGAGSVWVATRNPDLLVRVEPLATVGSRGSPRPPGGRLGVPLLGAVLVVPLLGMLLVMIRWLGPAWLRLGPAWLRPPPRSSTAAPAARSSHLLDQLRQFSEARAARHTES